ncbi:MAG: hypothetical protein NTY36_01450 [Deltaproteobacteria bacterium]|nr:hypothetical protein [Deltaproteobacteria bacterium]
MSNNEQLQARTEMFDSNQVSLFVIEGKDYLTSKDVGLCLGMANPAKAVNTFFQRNKEELEPHSLTLKTGLCTSKGVGITRLFDRTGCNLISMFARTQKSKTFRLWLAKLPEKVEKFQDKLRQAAPRMEASLQEAEARGVHKGFCLATEILAGKLDHDILAWVRFYRRQYLTFKETGLLLGISREKAQEIQRRLESLGFKFGKVLQNKRRKLVRDEFARELAQISAGVRQEALPGPAAGES